jgi:hypothetical protein
MKTIVRDILACLIGLVVGSGINMGLVILGPSIVPPPAGVDVTNAESIAASMHLFEPKHFVVPFLAHSLGTLFGALTAYVIAGTYKSIVAYAIGALFLVGGIYASTIIPAPAWFIALDVIVAYIPMAWIGTQLGGRLGNGSAVGAP